MNLKSFCKNGLMVALAFGLVAGSFNVSAGAREGFGRHSGFHGNGGLGRGGYRFGDRFEDNHPRRAEVLARDNRLNWQINRDRGHLGGNYGRLEQQQRAIRQQEQADARANGGYITKSEQAQLNKEENQLHQEIKQDYTGGKGEGFGPHSGFGGQGGLGRGGYHFGDRFEDNHPRRAEVLGRDNRLNWAINKDKGHLHGQYGALEQEQKSIRQQEQADARANGGYITKQEQQQLNQDENQLRQQINQDLNK